MSYLTHNESSQNIHIDERVAVDFQHEVIGETKLVGDRIPQLQDFSLRRVFIVVGVHAHDLHSKRRNGIKQPHEENGVTCRSMAGEYLASMVVLDVREAK